MKVLVTGGIGYIGSHTVVELLDSGVEVVVIDNLSNSKIEVVEKIKKITNKDFKFYKDDCLDALALEKIFNENNIDAVIHFAGFKAVGESVSEPLKYYKNNLISTINLLEVMKKHNCKKIVFSSSATVYGSPKKLPIKENFELHTTNPYGTTKLMIEDILRDLYKSDNEWSIAILRYFNPIGSHSSYLIGEDPNGIPNNLMPYIVKVALGKLECLNVFGDDYNTKDGTGVRDYIHVVDLAKGHIKALEKIMSNKICEEYNLGTGNGYSVLEIVNTFNKVNDINLNYKIIERRKGDIAACFADTTKAKKELNWEAKLGIEEMCKDSYLFAKNNE